MANYYNSASFCLDLINEKEEKWWVKELRKTYEDPKENNPNLISYDWEKSGEEIWFHHKESIDVDAAAETIKRFLIDCRPNGCCGFVWSCGCSKPRIGAFGGGACLVTAKRIKWISLKEWVMKQTQQHGMRSINRHTIV